MEVLIVEPHEGQLDARELASRDIGLGGLEAERPNLLPVPIGQRAHADARICRSACAILCARTCPATYQSAERGGRADPSRPPLERCAATSAAGAAIRTSVFALSSRSCDLDAPRQRRGLGHLAASRYQPPPVVQSRHVAKAVCEYAATFASVNRSLRSVGGLRPSMISSIRSGRQPRIGRGWFTGVPVFSSRLERSWLTVVVIGNAVVDIAYQVERLPGAGETVLARTDG